MKMKHKFIGYSGQPFYDEGYEVSFDERCIRGDKCAYCNLEITLEMIFTHFADENKVPLQKEIFEKKFPCISEEEYMIKCLVE